MVLRPALGETVGLARGESVALGAPGGVLRAAWANHFVGQQAAAEVVVVPHRLVDGRVRPGFQRLGEQIGTVAVAPAAALAGARLHILHVHRQLYRGQRGLHVLL